MSSAQNPNEQVESLGSAAGSGMAWLLAGNVFSKVLVVLSQVVLGWMLTKNDYGLYAIVMGIAMFIQTFRDGGVRDYLTNRGDEYEELEGPCFWLGLAINIVVALALGITGELVGLDYTKSGYLKSPRELADLVWIMASAVPFGSIVTVLTARLRIQMRFAALTIWTLVSSVIRYFGQIGMAFAGYGVYSLIVPVLAVAIVDAAWLMIVTRRFPARGAFGFRLWPKILLASLWLVLGNTAAGILNSGYFIFAGRFLPRETIGVVFFAVQLQMQVETTLGQAIVSVMQPVLARLNGDPIRQGQACLRIARTVTLIASPAVIGLALVFPAVERIVFGGKWAEAALPLAILSVGYIARSAFICVPNPLLLARGQFPSWCAGWAINCGIVLVAATGGAALAQQLGDYQTIVLSACVSLFLMLGCWWYTFATLGKVGVSFPQSAAACLSIVPMALACGGGVFAATTWLLAPILQRAIPWVLEIKAYKLPVATVAEVLLCGGLFTLLFGLGVRAFFRADLIDALGVVPQRLARPVRSLLRIPLT